MLKTKRTVHKYCSPVSRPVTYKMWVNESSSETTLCIYTRGEKEKNIFEMRAKFLIFRENRKESVWNGSYSVVLKSEVSVWSNGLHTSIIGQAKHRERDVCVSRSVNTELYVGLGQWNFSSNEHPQHLNLDF